MSLKDEAESKVEKISAILEAELLNLKALKELSWQGIPRKVSCTKRNVDEDVEIKE